MILEVVEKYTHNPTTLRDLRWAKQNTHIHKIKIKLLSYNVPKVLTDVRIFSGRAADATCSIWNFL
jgi:hypothetical protein